MFGLDVESSLPLSASLPRRRALSVDRRSVGDVEELRICGRGVRSSCSAGGPPAGAPDDDDRARARRRLPRLGPSATGRTSSSRAGADRVGATRLGWLALATAALRPSATARSPAHRASSSCTRAPWSSEGGRGLCRVLRHRQVDAGREPRRPRSGLVTDDVLALACANGDVVAHPGPSLMGLTKTEYDTLPPGRRKCLGLASAREARVDQASPTSHEGCRAPATLAAICFLERGEADGDLSLDEQHPPEPRLLLGANFLSYLTSREHLVAHLASCTKIAATTRAFTLRTPARMPLEQSLQEGRGAAPLCLEDS